MGRPDPLWAWAVSPEKTTVLHLNAWRPQREHWGVGLPCRRLSLYDPGNPPRPQDKNNKVPANAQALTSLSLNRWLDQVSKQGPRVLASVDHGAQATAKATHLSSDMLKGKVERGRWRERGFIWAFCCCLGTAGGHSREVGGPGGSRNPRVLRLLGLSPAHERNVY